MATLTLTDLTTAEELLALGPDFHGELVRGRIVEMAPAGWDYGDVALTIGTILHAFVRLHKLGRTVAAETGFTLFRDPDTVRAPDVAFVATANLPSTDEDRNKFFEGPPDLAVEVLSPSNSSAEMAEKIGDYLRAGTKLVWDRQSHALHGHDPRRVEARRGSARRRRHAHRRRRSGGLLGQRRHVLRMIVTAA